MIYRELNSFNGCRPKIPIVLYTWLDECIDRKMLVPLGNHLVGETGSSIFKVDRIISALSCNYEVERSETTKKSLENDGCDQNISFEAANFPRATISYGSSLNSQPTKRIKVNRSKSVIKSLMEEDLTLPEIALKDSCPETFKNPWIRRTVSSSNSEELSKNVERNFPIDKIKCSEPLQNTDESNDLDISNVFHFEIFSGKSFTSSGFSKKQVWFV